jgi:sterol desaturase/sphingolipid hydroxylase (fatty acid hydroxylase superfamily)
MIHQLLLFTQTYLKSVLAAVVNPIDNIDINMNWFLITGNLIFAIALYFSITWGKGRDLGDWFKAFFSPKIWFHKSTRLDFLTILLNGFIFSYFIVIYFPATNVRNYTYNHLVLWFGKPANHDKHVMAISILYSFIAFIFFELLIYWNHRLHHEIPFLWRFHKRHHSAEVLTILTVSRNHPLSTFANVNIFAVGFGVGSAVLMYVLGSNVSEIRIFGTNALAFVLALLGGLLSHSQIPMHFPKSLSKFILSPVMHQVHHSREKKHHNTNYASSFAFWDTLFGTSYIPEKQERFKFGIDETGNGSKQTLVDFYFKL